LVLIGAGGTLGGLARYQIGLAWVTGTGAFPWATFAINTAGAFVLALVVVVAARRARHAAYVRAALGTGFCGAFTTFSSVVTSADRLSAHGHAGLACSYVAVSLAAGIAAAWLGAAAGEPLAQVGRPRSC
jgi:CrcB protein